MKSLFVTVCLCLSALLSPTATAQSTDQPWVVYQGVKGPGVGKHIVFVSGDEEYRSEEALPQLAKIAAMHHGFRCTVLFPINRETGLIDPITTTNIPGTEALDTADLMVIATRFRDLPDKQMEPIDRYLKRGGPVVGLRTATHGFRIRDPDSRWKHYSDGYRGEKEQWLGGFGRLVLGEKWIRHWGGHKVESARGVIAPQAANHPIARGLKETDIWGPSDVYGIRLDKLPETFEPIILGHVIKRAGPEDKKDPFFGMRPTDKEVNQQKSDPAMPIGWTKSYTLPGGKPGRSFTTTMGAATDLVSEGTRRMILNGMYWALKMEDRIPSSGTVVKLVGEFAPTAYGFGGFKKNVKVSDHAWIVPGSRSKKTTQSFDPRIPALKILDQFVGDWVETVDMGEGGKAAGSGTGRWILGGTHLQTEFTVEANGRTLHHMTVMTWDAAARVYRSWMFSDSGEVVLFRGIWDDEKKTFTQTGMPDSNGVTAGSVTKVVSPDRMEWTAVMRGADGDIVMRLKGVDTRKKE